MPIHGDESGFFWDEPPAIRNSTGGKRLDFNPNGAQRLNYEPPREYRSFIGRERIGFDIETFDPDLDSKGPGAHRADGKVVGFAVAYDVDDATYYPTEHTNTERCVRDPEKFYSQLREDAAAYEGEIVGANLQYDLDWLWKRHNIRFPNAKIRDVQTAEPLLDENRLQYGLDVLSRDYGVGQKEGITLLDIYGKDYIKRMHDVDPGNAATYAEMDTILPLRLIDKQKVDLEAQGLTDLFFMESRLTPLLLQMRQVGVPVNTDRASEAYDMTRAKAKDAAEKLREECGFSVDVWSGPSIQRAFDKRGLDYPRTAKGAASFRKEWLANHPDPMAQLIVEQRTYEKIGGTFLKSYIIEGSAENVDGRLHCMFNQLKSDSSGTVSGRFSSSNPNLQNIPARHPELGPLCRSIFIPEEGMLWGSADWSQIEYRFLVHYAASVKSIDASAAVKMYQEDPTTDFHEIAAQITGVPRKVAKNINFGVVYGMGGELMAAQLGLPLNEAEAILNEFHERFPFLRAIYNTASARARKNHYISTILHRRRRFNLWEAKGKIYTSREAAEEAGGFARVAFTHKALNALLQGSAADLMKLAMVQMYEDGLFNVLVPHLTVHDEMNVSAPDTKEGREAFKEMTHIMETALTLKIPVLADAKLASNWDQAK